LALNGHRARADRCLLLGVQRTWQFEVLKTAFDPKMG
jgi:hypothetical protein